MGSAAGLVCWPTPPSSRTGLVIPTSPVRFRTDFRGHWAAGSRQRGPTGGAATVGFRPSCYPTCRPSCYPNGADTRSSAPTGWLGAALGWAPLWVGPPTAEGVAARLGSRVEARVGFGGGRPGRPRRRWRGRVAPPAACRAGWETRLLGHQAAGGLVAVPGQLPSIRPGAAVRVGGSAGRARSVRGLLPRCPWGSSRRGAPRGAVVCR